MIETIPKLLSEKVTNSLFCWLFCHFLRNPFKKANFIERFCKKWQNNPQDNCYFSFLHTVVLVWLKLSWNRMLNSCCGLFHRDNILFISRGFVVKIEKVCFNKSFAQVVEKSITRSVEIQLKVTFLFQNCCFIFTT